jgi:hypothetical protein
VSVTGYVESLLGGLPPDQKKVQTEIFRYVLPNGRFGPVSHQAKSENFSAVYVSSTTAAVANEEFNIVHGLGRIPYVVVPVLPLDVIGGAVVRLQVTRAADAMRVYLRSPDTSAVIALYLE